VSLAVGVAGFGNRDLCANPAYCYYEWTSLPEAYRSSIRSLIDPADLAGVLVAASDSPLPDKVVGRAGAELFAALRHPGRAPDDVSPEQLAALVLDGVLQVRADNGFVSGPAAYEEYLQPFSLWTPGDRLSTLSISALEHAGRLPGMSVEALTARLYGYHRMPHSARWARAYPASGAVLELLHSAGMAVTWEGPLDMQANTGWLFWKRRRGDGDPCEPGLPYKLYVSPAVEDLPEVLPTLVTALSATSATRFKLGASATGLLRPDKCVVYLRDAGELLRVTADLAAALAGVRPHGVPFSAELAGDGLLSWGGDPPADAGPVGGGAESWRLSVCRRLAEYLAAAKNAALQVASPVQYALARLAMDGVRLLEFAPTSLPAPATLTAGAASP
jgi:hypothetical protein